jgi:hypothetical protein
VIFEMALALSSVGTPLWCEFHKNIFQERNLNRLSVVFRGHREFFPVASEGFFPTRRVRFSDNLLKMPNRHFGITHAVGVAGILDRKRGYL